jgi:hypothetical protein
VQWITFFPLSPAHRAAREVGVVPGIAERSALN